MRRKVCGLRNWGLGKKATIRRSRTNGRRQRLQCLRFLRLRQTTTIIPFAPIGGARPCCRTCAAGTATTRCSRAPARRWARPVSRAARPGQKRPSTRYGWCEVFLFTVSFYLNVFLTLSHTISASLPQGLSGLRQRQRRRYHGWLRSGGESLRGNLRVPLYEGDGPLRQVLPGRRADHLPEIQPKVRGSSRVRREVRHTCLDGAVVIFLFFQAWSGLGTQHGTQQGFALLRGRGACGVYNCAKYKNKCRTTPTKKIAYYALRLISDMRH